MVYAEEFVKLHDLQCRGLQSTLGSTVQKEDSNVSVQQVYYYKTQFSK